MYNYFANYLDFAQYISYLALSFGLLFYLIRCDMACGTKKTTTKKGGGKKK